MGIRIQHRSGHHYRNDPRKTVQFESGLLQKDARDDLSKIQESYLELLHDRLIEDVTRGISLDTPIYRIDTLEHFRESLQKNELYLSSPCKWDDPWESFILRAKACLPDLTPVDMSAMRDSFYAQCWSRVAECEGIWKARYYHPSNIQNKSSDSSGIHFVGKRLVKIKTTVRRLMREIYKVDDPEGHTRFCIGAVQYKRPDEIKDMHDRAFKDPAVDKQEMEIIDSLLTKRLGYEYEQEVRLIYYEQFYGKDNTGTFRDHVVVSDIDPRLFVDEIEIDPWCSNDECVHVKTELDRLMGDAVSQVKQSSLLSDYEEPTIIFGNDCIVLASNRIIVPKS